MSADDHTVEVPVEALRLGLYVVALDRPWVETPFLFQGFAISCDGDLTTLRAYCRRVVIDVDRSDSAATAELRRDLARDSADPGELARRRRAPARRPTRRTASADDSAQAFGRDRFPDPGRFSGMVRVAHTARTRMRAVVDAVIADIRFGRMVDGAAARDAVEEMVEAVTANASAALWLTNLKDRDEYTSVHCVNVCVLALAFGRHLGLDRDALLRLGAGALLHDVGKTRTPKHILDKAGPLTVEEFEVMKRHPEDGYQIIREGGQLSREALEVIRLHHERLHGGGYPFGLGGDQIPRHVLITAISDTYDAMTSDRVYRLGMSPDRVLQSLYTEAGASFGTELVQEFIRCIGIFPVGSVVQLDSGAIGLVVASHADARLQPTILLLRTPDGEQQRKRVLVNLASAPAGTDAAWGRRIARSLEPASIDVDVGSVISAEFGLTGT